MPVAKLSALLFPTLLLAAALPAQDQEPIAFNRDIRPLLSDRCFQCHGFDARARKAGLRLDTWEGLTGAIEGRYPVVPGKPEQSEVVRRTSSDDPDFKMPPPGSGLSLNAEEKARLRRWIAEGADFAPHWAFLPPQRPPVPEVAHPEQARTPIDRFVLRQLERRGLALAPEADRETLIRRVSLDLTGLPPTPEEIDAFVADESPTAYEDLVDRLLASPRFGERMALMWLDAARYADTNGFHHDNIRTAWPYRDWVIAAFNGNMPYDRFVVEQLAGDLLPEATEAQRIATAFCRMHNINDEGGALDAEYRVEAVADRIETISTALMGLTLACARCHDHKYDPFTQEDYYSLYAYFNSVEERGVYAADFEQARAYPARLEYRDEALKAKIAAAEARLAEARAELEAAQPAIEAERLAFEAALCERTGIRWVQAELAEVASAEGLELQRQPDGSVLASGDAAGDTLTFALRTEARDLRLLRIEALTDPSLPGGSVGLAPNGNAVVTAVRATAVSLADPQQRQEVRWRWAWADHEQPNGDFDAFNLVAGTGEGWALQGHERKEPCTALLLSEQPFGFAGGTRIEVEIECRSRYGRHILGRPRLSLAGASQDLAAEFPVVASDLWLAGPFVADDFDKAYATAFGPERAAGIDRDARFGKVGWKHRPDFEDGAVHSLRGERAAFYLARTLHSPVPRRLALSLGSDDAIKVFLNGREVLANKVLRGAAADQERLEIDLQPGENVLVVKIANNGGPAGFYLAAEPVGEAPQGLAPAALIPAERRGERLQQRFAAEWSRARSPTWASLEKVVLERQRQLDELEAQAVPVVVMREKPEPTPTFVLTRGHYEGADENRPVSRRPPLALDLPLPEGAPANRLGFARWLTRPDHPLTARVHANRLWQMLFGEGIVRTSENFGQQSEWPTHPELLDWLAVRFAGSGWDQKALLRLIVTSATYRQSARARPEALAVDPQNRLLASFPRRRLPGELIRDQALYVAGLLVEKVGGPSVRPYQPEGLWKEVSIGGSSNTQIFVRDDGEALYRRSLYTFWKRTSPNPQMTTFDAPTREFCVVRRGTTNTPLQALVLWNDVQFVEAARVLAQRTLAEAEDDAARLERMFRRCTGRRPAEVERAILARTLARFRARYAGAPADAARLLEQGEAPRPERYDAAELAAWTLLANTVLSLDETLVRD